MFSDIQCKESYMAALGRYTVTLLHCRYCGVLYTDRWLYPEQPMAGGTHSGVTRVQRRPQSVENSRRTPWAGDAALLQPMLRSNCRKEEPDTSKSQLSA